MKAAAEDGYDDLSLVVLPAPPSTKIKEEKTLDLEVAVAVCG